MRPFKIHLHKHFGRKVTRRYIFQRKQKKVPFHKEKGPSLLKGPLLMTAGLLLIKSHSWK